MKVSGEKLYTHLAEMKLGPKEKSFDSSLSSGGRSWVDLERMSTLLWEMLCLVKNDGTTHR